METALVGIDLDYATQNWRHQKYFKQFKAGTGTDGTVCIIKVE
jgi:hypothetical protein